MFDANSFFLSARNQTAWFLLCFKSSYLTAQNKSYLNIWHTYSHSNSPISVAKIVYFGTRLSYEPWSALSVKARYSSWSLLPYELPHNLQQLLICESSPPQGQKLMQLLLLTAAMVLLQSLSAGWEFPSLFPVLFSSQTFKPSTFLLISNKFWLCSDQSHCQP